jgi:hypothetical protein
MQHPLSCPSPDRTRLGEFATQHDRIRKRMRWGEKGRCCKREPAPLPTERKRLEGASKCVFVFRSCGLSGRDMGGLIRQGGCAANRIAHDFCS